MTEPEITRRDFVGVAAAAAAVPSFNVYQDSLDEKVDANAKLARDSFQVFRKTIRPDMIWNPFVYRLTRELQRFADAMELGKRPKLAISTPPQHGKSTAAEDFAGWIAGKQPDWKTIYASYSDDLGVRCNLNLQRLFASDRYRGIFPYLEIGQTHSRGPRAFWQLNSGLIEFVDHKGSFRNTTVRGQITGMELNLGIIDDFVKGRAEAGSKNDRDKTWNWFTDDSGKTVHSGGYELGRGGTQPAEANGVSFSGGGMVQLDSLLSQFGGVISGFDLGDEIGPHSLGFGSSSSATSWRANAGAPGVDKGGNTFNLTLLGQYAAANFNAGADGHGGTLITDPSASSSVAQTPLVAHH